MIQLELFPQQQVLEINWAPRLLVAHDAPRDREDDTRESDGGDA